MVLPHGRFISDGISEKIKFPIQKQQTKRPNVFFPPFYFTLFPPPPPFPKRLTVSLLVLIPLLMSPFVLHLINISDLTLGLQINMHGRKDSVSTAITRQTLLHAMANAFRKQVQVTSPRAHLDAPRWLP
jgi:hypothetical protein